MSDSRNRVRHCFLAETQNKSYNEHNRDLLVA